MFTGVDNRVVVLARSRTQGFLRKFNLEGSRCMTTGTTEEAVATAITAILEGTESDVSSAFSTLAELDAAEVVGELFLWVEDVTEGVEVDRLIQTSRIQPPENARAIVEAIRARDMKGLERATSSNDLGVAINALIGVIVSFKDAREQTDPEYAQRTRREKPMKTREEQVLRDNLLRSARKGLIATGVQLGGTFLAVASMVLLVIFSIQQRPGLWYLMPVGVGVGMGLAYYANAVRIQHIRDAREYRDRLDALRASRG